MQFNTLPIRYKVFAFALGLFFLTWLFAGFVLLPAQQHMAELEKQLKTERDLNKAAQDFSMIYPEPVKYLRLLDDKLNSLDRMLPPELRVSEFLSQSEAAAKNSGVQLVSLKPGTTVNKNGYREWSMELIVRGNYFQTMNFIKKMEEGPLFNSVISIAMQSKSTQLESKLVVSIYSYAMSTVQSTQISAAQLNK